MVSEFKETKFPPKPDRIALIDDRREAVYFSTDFPKVFERCTHALEIVCLDTKDAPYEMIFMRKNKVVFLDANGKQHVLKDKKTFLSDSGLRVSFSRIDHVHFEVKLVAEAMETFTSEVAKLKAGPVLQKNVWQFRLLLAGALACLGGGLAIAAKDCHGVSQAENAELE